MRRATNRIDRAGPPAGIALWLGLLAAAACGAAADPPVRLVDDWPASVGGDYEDVTRRWTRQARMRGPYQEAIELTATFKSPEWRAARAQMDADARGLEGEARAQRLAQARAEAAGPYEFHLMLVTWDRRESDLDRGAKSVWRVRLLDEQGFEVEPLEIIKDKRPPFIIRQEFPAHGDFATSYVARFPRTKPLLGPEVRQLRLRISSSRGGISLIWRAP